MDKSKIANLNPQEYTHLPHAEQKFEDHEQTDVAIRPLVWTLATIAVLIVVSGIGMWGLFSVYKSSAEKDPTNQQLSQVKPAIRQVPEGYPALQGVPAAGANPNSPAVDMILMKRRNDAVLEGKAPMRQGLQPGMSIDRAIDEALSRKIFKTGPAAAAAGAPPATQASR